MGLCIIARMIYIKFLDRYSELHYYGKIFNKYGLEKIIADCCFPLI